jgi:hypothetical protein
MNVSAIRHLEVARPSLGEGEVRQLLFLLDSDKNGKISKQGWMNVTAAEFDRLDKRQSGDLDANQLSNHETYNADIHGIKSRIAGLRSLDLRHTAANKLLEQGTRFLVLPRFLVGRRARRSAWQSAAVTFGLKCNDKAISSSEINLRGH